jgi:hypothetical protein
MLPKIIRPDSRGRINLGRLASGVSGFSITQTRDRKIVLEPYVEIPFKEMQAFKEFLLPDLLLKVTPQNLHSLELEIEEAPQKNEE